MKKDRTKSWPPEAVQYQNWKNKLKISSAMNKMEKINWRYLVEKRTVKVQRTTDSFSNNGGGKYWKKLLEPACQRNQLGDGTLQFLKTFGAGPLEQEGLKIKPAQDLMPFCHFCYFEMLSFDTFGVFAAGWLLNKSGWWKEAGPKERIFISRFVFRRQPVKVLSKIIHQSKAGQNRKYDITKAQGVVKVCLKSGVARSSNVVDGGRW